MGSRRHCTQCPDRATRKLAEAAPHFDGLRNLTDQSLQDRLNDSQEICTCFCTIKPATLRKVRTLLTVESITYVLSIRSFSSSPARLTSLFHQFPRSLSFRRASSYNAAMGLILYRRHRRDCKAGHAEDFKTSEFDERKKGWKRCECPITADEAIHYADPSASK